MTGCWFSLHNSFGLRTTRIDASWSSGTKPIPAAASVPGPVEVGVGARWACHRQTDRQPAQVLAVVPYPVGIADADLGHPVLLGDGAGYLAVEGGVELALDVELGQSNARRLDAVGADHNIGIAEANVRVYIDDALDLLDDFADFGSQVRGGSPAPARRP